MATPGPAPGALRARGMCPRASGVAALRTLAGAPLENLDLSAARREALFTPPATLASRLTALLADPRDAPLLFALLNVAVAVPPAAAALLLARPSHALGACYFATVYALFAQRFLLALHFSQHRRLFKPGALDALRRVRAALRRACCTSASQAGAR